MMTMEDISRRELHAAASRFEVVVADWALDEAQTCRLLGLPSRDPDPAAMSADAEARMRLVVEIDALLHVLLGGVEVAEWIREPNDGFVGSLTPLDAMCEGRHVLRGLRNVLADRPRLA